jgi:hypothetical protein
MRLFQCQACGEPLYFESVACESCGRRLGFLPAKTTMTAIEQDGGCWTALADPAPEYVYCANRTYRACNWLVKVGSEESFCLACRHNRTIPDLTDERNLSLWRRLEVAKRRLFYSLIRLNLPLLNIKDDPNGLVFDFLSRAGEPVMTGHLNGVITINLAEADDSERERQRGAMGEPYRTLLGHFRHEVAHYYWDRLVRDQPSIDEFRAVFGDERADYGEALARHHSAGAPEDWSSNFVTAYASSHPWEDFAETWAHYFHIVDTLETAHAFGVRTHPRVSGSEALNSSVDFDPYKASVDRLIDAWLPLTFAFNSINRSMGINDLYPFLLGTNAILKLNYIYDQIHRPSQTERVKEQSALRAIVASLKKGATRPN